MRYPDVIVYLVVPIEVSRCTQKRCSEMSGGI